MTFILEIISATCAHYRVKEEDMLGRCRHSEIVLPRFAAMILARKYCWPRERTLKAIGRAFGRSHGAVLNAIKKKRRFFGPGEWERFLALEFKVQQYVNKWNQGDCKSIDSGAL